MNATEPKARLLNRLRERAVLAYEKGRDDTRAGAILAIVQALLDTREDTYREVFAQLQAPATTDAPADTPG